MDRCLCVRRKDAEMATNIKVNGDVTVNGDVSVKVKLNDEHLLDNGNTFFQLMSYLNTCPEMLEAERSAREMKKDEERKARLMERLGEDYKYFVEDSETDIDAGYDEDSEGLCEDWNEDSEDTDESEKKEFKNGQHRLSAEGLRENYRLIAHRDMGDGYCDVFSNGYGIYDDGNRQTILWVPDCAENTCYFNPLKDSEKEYLPQKDEVDPRLLGGSPWYVAVMLGGADRITWNMNRPKSKTTMSDMDRKSAEESTDSLRQGYVSGSHFDNPESVYIRKETLRELRAVMDLVTREQLEAYQYYYDEGYTEEAIGEILGIDASNVCRRLQRLRLYVKNGMKKYF